jgi:hypothetical protein
MRGRERDQGEARPGDVEGALGELLGPAQLDPADGQDRDAVEALDRDPVGGHAEQPGRQVQVHVEAFELAVDALGGGGRDRPARDQDRRGVLLQHVPADLGRGADDRGEPRGRRGRVRLVEEPDDREAEPA